MQEVPEWDERACVRDVEAAASQMWSLGWVEREMRLSMGRVFRSQA